MRSPRRVVPVSPEFPTGYVEDEAADFAEMAGCFPETQGAPQEQETHVTLHLALAVGHGIEVLRGQPYVAGPNDRWSKLILPHGCRLLAVETRTP